MKRFPKNQGLTLVELVIYMSIMTLLTTAIVSVIVGLTSTYHKLKVVKRVERSAVISLDRMTREIRNATSVDVVNSVLGTSPGVLQLNAVTPGGTNRVVKFAIIKGTIHVYEGGVDQGPLSSESASTTSLIFRRISTPKSEAVKIEMTIIASTTKFSRSANFYDTIVLRGSY